MVEELIDKLDQEKIMRKEDAEKARLTERVLLSLTARIGEVN